MSLTIEQLFENGAQNTVIQMVIEGNASIANIQERLIRRYGGDAAGSESAIEQLRQRVFESRDIADILHENGIPQPSDYPINPAAIDAYEYTVIAEIPDPLDEERTISVPWTTRSDSPLSGPQVLEQAARELHQGVPPPDTLVGARGADLTRRRLRFQQDIHDRGLEQGDITIEILGGYRRG